jgi:hypothetical protein
MKSFTPTDLPDHVAHATRRCGIDSSVFTITDQSMALPKVRFVSEFFIDS